MMTDLTTKIGRYDAFSASVEVVFTSGDLVHQRNVNAVLNAQGKYDKAATALRVADVARGVHEKMKLGVIGSKLPSL